MDKASQKILYKLIGRKISDYLIKTKELKQVELAKMLGVTKPTLSNILSGKRNLSLHLFVEISQKLDIDPKELLPSLMEINDAIDEKQKNIENILDSKSISANDRDTILKSISINTNK